MSRGPENGCPRGSLSPLHSNRRQISSLFPLSFFTLLPRLRRCVCVALKGALSKPGHSYHYLSLSLASESQGTLCFMDRAPFAKTLPRLFKRAPLSPSLSLSSERQQFSAGDDDDATPPSSLIRRSSPAESALISPSPRFNLAGIGQGFR